MSPSDCTVDTLLEDLPDSSRWNPAAAWQLLSVAQRCDYRVSAVSSGNLVYDRAMQFAQWIVNENPSGEITLQHVQLFYDANQSRTRIDKAS